MNYASPFWQQVLVGLAIFYLLIEMWRGWRKGVIRMTLSLLALGGASLAFYVVNAIASSVLDKILPVPAMVAGVFFGTLAAVAVYLIIWFMSALLFKRTEHHNSGLVRFLFGAGGALLGIVYWAVIVVAVISSIRLLGAFSEAQIAGRGSSPGGWYGSSSSGSGGVGGVSRSISSGLATLKQSMEIGPAGKVVQSVNVIPTEGYDLIVKIGRLTSDQNAVARFVEYPGTQELLNDPRLVALSRNPDVQADIQNKNILAMLQNKDVLATLNDPALLDKVSKFDLAKALDYALAKPGQPGAKATNPYP